MTTHKAEIDLRPIYTCSRCGRRLAEHGSHQPGWFRCPDGTDTPWSEFTSEPQAERAQLTDAEVEALFAAYPPEGMTRQQQIEALIADRIAAERQRIQNGLHQMCEESTEGLYGDYGPVMLIGEQVEALVDDKPWDGLGVDEEDNDDD